MKLEKLLENAGVQKTNCSWDIEINGIKTDSREVGENDLFVCLEGINDDGNRHLQEIKTPFVALTQKEPSDESVRYVLVGDVRRAYAICAENWFLHPLSDMKFVSVVGTNGKTSTAHYISQMLTFAGFKTGLIGTEGHFICGEKTGQSLTTPDPLELNELFFKMRSRGCDVVIAEVSAHAIYLEKLGDIKADVGVLTNVSQDHLDYFKDFANYQGVKMSYFENGGAKLAVVNADDESGRILLDRLEKTNVSALSYGLYSPADCFAINVDEGIDGIRFVANICDDIVDVKSSLYGEFNVYNLLSAMTVCKALGVDSQTLAHAVRKVRTVKGRFSVLPCEKGTIIIDFAHTPDGLKNLLSTARTITKSRLITLFGCGGDRDKSKRALMGKVASRYSDYIVITSDNPRSEDPAQIMKDIEWGVDVKDCKCIQDRTEAVRFALAEMEEGDTLVLAGKGNETYLEIKGKKIPYSDFDVVARYGQLR